VFFEILDNSSIQRLQSANTVGRQEFKTYITAKVCGFATRNNVHQQQNNALLLFTP
jgi:hypothetical protein